MKIISQSNRIILREWNDADAEFLYQLNSDPQVLRYTADGPFDSVEAARTFIDAYDQYETNKMGRWLIDDIIKGKTVGWCGLKLHSGTDDKPSFIDLGYRLLKEAWGCGYATEASKMSIQYGFEQLNLEKIIARAQLPNKASFRVMEKIGMGYSHHDIDRGHEIAIYSITRIDYLSTKK